MKSLFVLTVLFSFTLFAQQPVRQDSTLFDFWVGNWDLSWKNANGTASTGTNIITKILDGTAIQENFTALTGSTKGYKGQSVSILDAQTGVWKQTWIDNQGAYMPFTGGSDGPSRFFAQEFMKNGKLVKQKMVFHDITKEMFVWDWMSSPDSGKSWTINWSVNYRRMK